MAGIYEHIKKHRYKSIYEVGNKLNEVIEDVFKHRHEPRREFVLYTGELGMICFDLAILGLHLNVTILGGFKTTFRSTGIRYYFSLFKKEGMYKARVKTSPARFDLYRGTEFLWSTKDINQDTIFALKRHSLQYKELVSKQKPLN